MSDARTCRASYPDYWTFSLPPHAGNWSAIDWYNLPDTSPTLAALKAESERRGWTYHEEIYRPTPRIPLNGSFDEYLSRLDKKQRHEIRRKMRRAAEVGPKSVFTMVDKNADIETELDAFFHLMIQDPNKASSSGMHARPDDRRPFRPRMNMVISGSAFWKWTESESRGVLELRLQK